MLNRKVKERKTKKPKTSLSMDEIGDKSQITGTFILCIHVQKIEGPRLR
jgi:hypothetical protein